MSEKMLHEALTIRRSRVLCGDGTMDIAGVTFESTEGFLVGKKVTVGRSLLNPTDPSWVEHDGRRFVLQRVDAVANSQRSRPSPASASRRLRLATSLFFRAQPTKITSPSAPPIAGPGP